MDLRLDRLQRLGGVGHGGERLVVDLDQLGRVLGLPAGLGHDEGDIVADIVDLVAAEDGVLGIGTVRSVPVLDRDQAGNARLAQVGPREDRQHTRCGCRGSGVDAADAGMGMGRAQHEAVRQIRQVDVISVAAPAGDQALILDPADRLTDPELCHLPLPHADERPPERAGRMRWRLY
jgi:hypothetical protein